MSERLERIRERLLPAFRSGLDDKHARLVQVFAAHRAGSPDAREQANRVAHQIRGSAASFGLSGLGVASAAVEFADAERFPFALSALIEALHRACADGAEDPGTLLVLDPSPAAVTALIGGLSKRGVAVLIAADIEAVRGYLRTLEFDAIALHAPTLGSGLGPIIAELRERRAPKAALVVHDSQVASRRGAASFEGAPFDAAEVWAGPLDAAHLPRAIEALTRRGPAARSTPTPPPAGR